MEIKNCKLKICNGFSLVELLVVISIIAVLTAILTANFMGARERARDAQKIQDLYAIKNALRMYYNDHQSYPDSGFTSLNSAIGTSYMTALTDVGYTYIRSTDGDGFNLCVNLEAGAGDEDTNSQVKCGSGRDIGVCGLGIGITRDKIFVVCGN